MQLYRMESTEPSLQDAVGDMMFDEFFKNDGENGVGGLEKQYKTERSRQKCYCCRHMPQHHYLHEEHNFDFLRHVYNIRDFKS